MPKTDYAGSTGDAPDKREKISDVPDLTFAVQTRSRKAQAALARLNGPTLTGLQADMLHIAQQMVDEVNLLLRRPDAMRVLERMAA